MHLYSLNFINIDTIYSNKTLKGNKYIIKFANL